MNKIEMAKIKLELIRVSAAKAEQEFLILQREEEIERLKAAVAIQIAKEEELKAKLEEQGWEIVVVSWSFTTHSFLY